MTETLLNILLLLVGFVLLIKGADFFVDGASSISKKCHIPPVIIGLTIVALGTSCPEAAVSIRAAMAHNNEIAVSNVAGSNIFNMAVVIGACALFKNVTVQKDIIKRDFPICIILSALTLLFVTNGDVSRPEGIILIILFFLYVALLASSAIKNKDDGNDEIKEHSVPVSLLFLAGGLAAIVFGGDLVVEYASSLAKTCGMSDTLVGLTIVALGTSLPELVTSITAIKKGFADMAVGNVVGSNIFNILFVLSLSAAISPITGLNTDTTIDFVVVLICAIFGYLLCIKKKEFRKKDGILLLAFYLIYTTYIILRNYI